MPRWRASDAKAGRPWLMLAGGGSWLAACSGPPSGTCCSSPCPLPVLSPLCSRRCEPALYQAGIAALGCRELGALGGLEGGRFQDCGTVAVQRLRRATVWPLGTAR